MTLTLNITGLTEIESIEDGIFDGDCYGDFEYRISIDGNSFTNPEFSLDPPFGVGCIISFPFEYSESVAGFTAVATVDDGDIGIPVTIEVVDIDTVDDDTLDISPDPAAEALRLNVDPITGQYVLVNAFGQTLVDPNGGPTVSPGRYEGTGGDAGAIELNISSTAADSDGDGMPDAVETAGTDWDGSGIVGDVPGEITDPNRADVFLELDMAQRTADGQILTWTREEIQAMKASFARAPWPNPDGSIGINLWIDTGNLADASATEGAAAGTCFDGIDQNGGVTADGADNDCDYLEGAVEDGPATCVDGIDNNGDGLTDGADPTCLVGDNLGGGGLTGTNVASCNLAAAFYTAKNADTDGDGVPEDLDGDGAADNLFAVNRRPWFRYGISVPSTNPCNSGGQAEIGGNDFIDHNGDPGTLMHEFGHTLGLQHGGADSVNCKPNHVSVMSYTQQSGINRVGGGRIIDFSPAGIDLTIPTSRSQAFTTVLDEGSLDETALVPTDPANRFVFANSVLAPADLDRDGTNDGSWGALVTQNLNAPADWDGIGGAVTSAVVVDASRAGRITVMGNQVVSPTGCAAPSPGQTHRSFNEWALVQLPFRVNGDSANSALNPVVEDEPTIEELVLLQTGLKTTDLSLAVDGPAAPVVAGTSFEVELTVVNHGPNPADAIEVDVVLPDELKPGTLPDGCTTTDTGLQCVVFTLLAGEDVVLSVELVAAADAAYRSPVNISIDGELGHDGMDAVPADNAASISVDIMAEADLSLSDLSLDGADLGIVGGPVPFDAEMTAASGGPSSPMDAEVEVTVAHPFAAADPAIQTLGVDAVAVGEPQVVAASFSVTCADAGTGSLQVSANIAPASPFDTDPESANNGVAVGQTLECLLPVTVNIRPGQFPNAVNAGRGRIELGVLSTEAGEYDLPLSFDTDWVDPATVRLGLRDDVLAGGGAPVDGKVRESDLRERSDERTRDGDDDLRVFFRADATGLAPGDTEACVVGTFSRPDGTGGRFLACDSVDVRPAGGPR